MRAGHRPLPPGALPGAAAAAGEGLPRRVSRHTLGGSPGGGWGGPGRRRQPTPAAEGRRSFLLPSPPAPMRVCADGARQSPSRPRPAPASISTGGGGRSNNLPSPCWKEATSGPQPEREEAAAVSREAGRAEGSGRAGGTRLLPAPRQRYRSSGAAGGSGEGRTEMAAATWELDEEEGQGFPSGPPALGGGGGGRGGRVPGMRHLPLKGGLYRGSGKRSPWERSCLPFLAAAFPEKKRPGLRLSRKRAESSPQHGGEREKGGEKRVGVWEVSGLPGALPQPLPALPGPVALPAAPLGCGGVGVVPFFHRLRPRTKALSPCVSPQCTCTRSIVR